MAREEARKRRAEAVGRREGWRESGSGGQEGRLARGGGSGGQEGRLAIEEDEGREGW